MPKSKKFNALLRSVRKEYLGKSVPAKYQDRYGKRYDKKEVINVAYAIAKSKHWKV